jgi:hypothetical protein
MNPAIKYEARIEDESANIIEDESIESKKINPVITIGDEFIDPKTHRVVYKSKPCIHIDESE